MCVAKNLRAGNFISLRPLGFVFSYRKRGNDGDRILTESRGRIRVSRLSGSAEKRGVGPPG